MSDRCPACRRPVVKVKTLNERTQMLDPGHNDVGTVVIRPAAFGPPVAITLRKDEQPRPGENRYMPHRATCPNAKWWERQRARAARRGPR